MSKDDINVDIPKDSNITEVTEPENVNNSKYVKYMIILDILQYVFAATLSLAGVIFSAIQITRVPNSEAGMYFALLVGIILIWVPVKGIKSKVSKDLAKKFVSV